MIFYKKFPWLTLLLLLPVALGGCVVAPLIAGGATIEGMTTVREGVLEKALADNYGEEEMARVLKIGQKRHPDVFAPMTIGDRAFNCLFIRQIQRYDREMKASGENEAKKRAIDRAASEYRDGVCGTYDLKRRVFGPMT